MTIYIDENLPPLLARGFNILQKPENIKLREAIEVKSIKDEFGQGVKDEEWIPKAGESNACVITQDYNILRIDHQRELCIQYDLGMFYFRPPSKNGFGYWEILKLFVKHWQDICKKATRENRPFAYKITSRGEMKEL